MVLANRFLFRIPGQEDWTDSLDEIRKKCPAVNTPIEIKDTIATGYSTKSGAKRGRPIGLIPVDMACAKFG